MHHQQKRIFISTGEVSGDLQGALLIAALHREADRRGMGLEITALGGDRMADAGANLLGNTSAIGSVGLLESLPYIVPILSLQRRVKEVLKSSPPDAIVLIDYMGSNLNLGQYLRRVFPQVPIVYYIMPQCWVWSISDKNTQDIIEMSDRLLAIFPEEAKFFRDRQARVTWVGHPLVDAMETAPTREEARSRLQISSDAIAIALLPASRPQELKSLMPTIFAAAAEIQRQLPEVEFWIPLSLEAYRDKIETAIDRYGLRGKLVRDRDRTVLAAADFAIAKSGTVNLELAILNVPQVVVYRVHPVTAWIARKLLGFSIPFMSPPNLVEMKAIVPELLQEEVTVENIVSRSLELLPNTEKRQKMLADYEEMRQVLGAVGGCDRAAREIFTLMKS